MDLANFYPLKFAAQLGGDAPIADFPELYSKEQPVLDVSGNSAIRLLVWELACQRQRQSSFLKKIRRASHKLHALLDLHGHPVDESQARRPSRRTALAFAQALIAFDKLNELTGNADRAPLPAARLARIRAALQQLDRARAYFSGRASTTFARAEVARTCDLENELDLAGGEVVKVDNPCVEARRLQQQNVQQLVDTIAALRISELCCTYRYEESLHDAYFEDFGFSHLTTEDLQYLPLILVIEDSRQLQEQAGDLLALWTNDSQVKVLGINRLDTLYAPEQPADASYLELAALTIMRRNAYVFQGGLEAPTRLQKAYAKGLDFPGPVLWNVLLPTLGVDDKRYNYLNLLAAAESRCFPRLEYLNEANQFACQQLSLADNPAPTDPFSTYDTVAIPATDHHLTPTFFTVADFLAMNAQGRNELQLLPKADSTAIPVADSLLDHDQNATGRKVYLWLANPQQLVRQALVPFHWLQWCRGRFEYWRFLQALAGVAKGPQPPVTEERAADELATLRAELKARFAQTRSADLQQALVRILYRLLDQEEPLGETLRRISQRETPTSTTDAQLGPETKSVAAVVLQPVGEETPSLAINEAWVDSEDCTSCGDCINALSEVFKYNGEDQAYVYNPHGGTFAQIVAAAEKCPAACIHPGIPQNPDETNLDKWRQRAAKFN
jgi:ferredoxin